jgi:group I intron endonuclease
MSKVYGIVYKATNKVNGKMYIGQTTYSLNVRIKEHLRSVRRKKSKYYFHKAIKKYGIDNFDWEIIVKCNSLEELNRAEIETIKKYNTFGGGYNLTKGGEGVNGYVTSEETKKKISNSLKGKMAGINHPMWGIKGEASPNYGKKRTMETKQKMSKSRKGKYVGENHPWYGKKHSEKTIRLLSSLWIVFFPNGDRKIIRNLRKFCRDNNLSAGSMVDVSKGRQRHCKNYKCKRLYEELIICQS